MTNHILKQIEVEEERNTHMAVGQNRFGIPFWLVGAPPILVGILVGIGMFTGGVGLCFTHGHLRTERNGAGRVSFC